MTASPPGAEDRDAALARSVLQQAVVDEPPLTLDLGEVRRVGRRQRRRRRLGSTAVAAVLVAGAVTAVVALPAALRPGAPAAPGPLERSGAGTTFAAADGAQPRGEVADDAVRAGVVSAQTAGTWRTKAVAAAVGGSGAEARAVPVELTPPVRVLRDGDGRPVGATARLSVDVLGVGSASGSVDLEIEVRRGGEDVGPCPAPADPGCGPVPGADGAVVHVGRSVAGHLVAHVRAGDVQVVVSAVPGPDGVPVLPQDRVVAVATAPVLLHALD
ncbi:hypothetical protein [Thalassiella azotivora]